MEKDYKYELNSKHKGQCPSCHKKKCFVFWHFRGTQTIVHKDCGVCDHINGCGYKLAPWQLPKEEQEAIKGNPNYQLDSLKSMPKPQEKPIEPISKEYLLKSQAFQRDGTWIESNLTNFLMTLIPSAKVKEAAIRYHLGVTKAGQSIFWQVDEFGRVRGGKIMSYRDDGHRVKDSEGNGKVGWIHTMLKQWGILKPDWELRQTLFGMHLLKRPENDGKPIAIVESEKTALICSIFDSKHIWMATGGLCNLKREKLETAISQRRDIILYPDRDGWKRWSEQAKDIGYAKIRVSDYCETNSTEADGCTADMADIIIRRLQEQQAEQANSKERVIETAIGLTHPHQLLRELINKYDLELINNN